MPEVVMSVHGHRNDAWHRSLDTAEPPEAHDEATRHAVEKALRMARECHDRHQLLNPFEAMALACKDGHSSETLYSIARTAAHSCGADVEVVHRQLERLWPDFV